MGDAYVLRGSPATIMPPSGVDTLPALLEWQVAQRKDAPLFSFCGEGHTVVETLSYRQVYEQSLLSSAHLRSILDLRETSGIFPGNTSPVVGIWFEKSIDLHMAILATTFAGAGWLPFDADAPTARVTACLSDSNASIVICDRRHSEAAHQAAIGTNAIVLVWQDFRHAFETQSQHLPTDMVSSRPRHVSRPVGSDTAYFIYTSGSTGTPKGIEISHHAAVTFALSEQSILGTDGTDVVWQGFSAAFDMFIEEVWVSLAGGAHLVIGSRSECQNVSGLGGSDGIWAQRGVTVVNAVPTLINIMTSIDDECGLPPSVRVLNLGGEACPPALVNRLWHKNLRIFNTYGPSETTVTATYQELLPNVAVTIGRPLPGYHALLLAISDDNESSLRQPLQLVVGAEGELCIGGPCLGKGYVGREELTAEKFVAHPFPSFPEERLYRTGDRVRLDDNQNLLFLGRIDTQVKHRGFRIELGEIETALSTHLLVQTAAVILSSLKERLEAYVVAKEAIPVKDLRKTLSMLPSYMQPEAFFFLQAEEMPRLPSGKINAKALQDLSSKMSDETSPATVGADKARIALDIDEDCTLGILLKAMTSVFPQAGQILPSSDFFDDLGGHSLAAAVLVSKFRKESDPSSPLASLGLHDVYTCRTAQAMADRYSGSSQSSDSDFDYSAFKEYQTEHSNDAFVGGPTGRDTGTHLPVSQTAFLLCGLAQLPALLIFFLTSSIEFLTPYLVFEVVLRRTTSIVYAILSAYSVFVATPATFMIIGILGKWIVLGKTRAGEYPLYGIYYYRFWLAERFVDLVNLAVVADGPMLPFMLRMLGANVGKCCHIGAVTIGAACDLVSIGDDVVIGRDVLLATSVVERGRLILKPVVIERNTYVGSSSILEGGARIEEGGELADLSMLADGARIPCGQKWQGSPARFVCDSPSVGLERSTRPSLARRALMSLAMGFSTVFVFPFLYFAPQIPGLLLFELLQIRTFSIWQQTGLFAVPASFSYIMLVFVEMVLLRWIVLGRLKPGSHGICSVFFYRHWFVERIMAMCLDILKPVYATLYVVPFMRCLGVKVGNWAEVSTARGIQFELTQIGNESFIADNVLMGATSVRGNALHLAKTTLQARAFAGNSAVIPQGIQLASNTLVGVLSIAPDAKSAPLESGQSCFGTPPVLMPARQSASTCHAAHLLYRPRANQIAQRLFIEGLRIWLPRFIIILGLGYGLQVASYLYTKLGVVHTLLMLPLFYLFLFVVPALFTIIVVKWILIGRYRPAEWPLWSRNVWLSEFVTSMYETLLGPLLTDRLVGTPYLAMVFRLLGVKIGSRVTMLSSDITEHDMVQLDDEAVINRHAGPQTHLFEDRVMKVGKVHLEKGACMKPYSICLPNSQIGAFGQLGSLSLLMKGESVPANQAWEGAPIAPRKNRDRLPFDPIRKTPGSPISSPAGGFYKRRFPENTFGLSGSMLQIARSRRDGVYFSSPYSEDKLDFSSSTVHLVRLGGRGSPASSHYINQPNDEFGLSQSMLHLGLPRADGSPVSNRYYTMPYQEDYFAYSQSALHLDRPRGGGSRASSRHTTRTLVSPLSTPTLGG